MTGYGLLLVIHLVGVALWLGGAVYERIFLVGNIRRLKGTGHEANVLRMLLSTEGFFVGAAVTVLSTGILLSIWSGAGFFQLTWLGVKQGVMLGILVLFAGYIGPQMGKLKRMLKEQTDSFAALPEESYRTVRKLTVVFDLAHAGLVLNVIMAVWKL